MKDESITQTRKKRLQQYIYIKGEYEDYVEELARLENNQYIPAMGESSGFSKSSGASCRMENAIMRYTARKESIQGEMNRLQAEMESIETAIFSLSDVLERRVLRLRYVVGADEGRKHMKWADVASRIYGNADDTQMQAIFRVHGHALQDIRL